MNSSDLKQHLLYLHMQELRDLCEKYALPNKGKKQALIARVVHFVETGEIITEPKLPAISKAKKGVDYPLKPHTLILKGSYKNDLKTRLFFKELIGEYFHFTAFGQDWIYERWLEGKPPTYQEFAEMWKVEYAKRKKWGTTPKEEWAYINFTQKFMGEHPNAYRARLLKAWEAERIKHKESALKLLAEKK